MSNLTGKIALVTGATGYLGIEMSRALGRAGATVLVNSRSAKKAETLTEKLCSEGLKARSAVFDVRDNAALASFAEAQAGSPLHILVNNAYGGVGGTIRSSGSDEFKDAYEVVVVAAHQLLKAMLPNLKQAHTKSGDASVVNIASMYGVVSPDLRVYSSERGSNPPFYGAAKAALIQYSRYAACEFGQEGIRVNTVAPGPFPSTKVQAEQPNFVKTLAGKVPMGRIGAAHEIGGPVVFLASSDSSYVNGAVLSVDGGWTSW